MAMFGSGSTVTTTFAAKDNMSPVVRGIRNTMSQFKRDASTGFGLAAGFSIMQAVTKAIDFAGESLKAYADEQTSVAKLTTALRENARAWDGNVDAIEAIIRSRIQLGFSDDEQRDSLALTVAAIGNVEDALKLQRTAMDLARLRGISLGQASDALTKAYNGNTGALGRMGIKLQAGVRGLKAVEEVQRRAGGQARAYAETTKGAMEVSAIAFDEFKESVGGALNSALQPFFKLVVDLTNQTPDLDTSVGRLTRQYRDQIEALKGLGQEAGDTNDVFAELYWFFAPQDKQIHEFTGTLGDFQRILGVTRLELAYFTEAGLAAGKTLPELRLVLEKLVQTQVAERAKEVGYAWQTGMDTIVESTPPAIRSMRSIERETKVTFDRVFATMDDMKAPWIAAWRQMAAWAKDPFRPKAFENWLNERAEKAMEKARQAAKNGQPKVAERWRRVAAAMRNPITRSLVNMGMDVDAAIAKIIELQQLGDRIEPLAIVVTGAGGGNGTGGTRGTGGGKSGGKGGKGAKGNKNGGNGQTDSAHQPSTGTQAMGGFLAAGESSLVGENGPEVITLSGSGGYVTPNHHLNRPIVINVDGRKLFEITDARSGRAIAMGG